MPSHYPPHRAHSHIMKLTAAGVAVALDRVLTDEDWLLSIAAAKGECVAYEDGLFRLAGYSARTRGQLVEMLSANGALS